jgi:hypothetical protein
MRMKAGIRAEDMTVNFSVVALVVGVARTTGSVYLLKTFGSAENSSNSRKG